MEKNISYSSLKELQFTYMNEFEVLKKESEKNLILYNKELYDKYYSIFKDLYNQINNLNENSDFDNIKTEYINTFNILKAILNEDNPLQARCVWHRPNEHSTEEIKSFVEWIKSLNFNIIFLEAYYAGRSCYKSEFLEVHPAQKNDKFEGFDDDYLKCLTYFCKLNNIQVHLWNHALNAGGEGLSIPEYIKDNWLLRNYQNKIGHSTCYGDTYYLDPSNTEVLEFVKSIYTEQVSRYDIDGVQLDYIRYYENNYDDHNNIFESGFGEHSEKTFKTKYNLSSDLDIRKEILSNQEIKNKFFEFRQNNVYNCVKEISKAVRNIKNNIIISASVVGDINYAKNIYMQNWDKWIENGYIDMLNPMIYTHDSKHLKALSLTISKYLDNRAFLSSGIASLYYRHPKIEHQNQINTLNDINIQGFSVFATHNLRRHKDATNLMCQISNRYFPINIFSNKSQIINEYISYLKNKYLEICNLYNLEKNLYEEILNVLDNIKKTETFNILDDNYENVLYIKLKHDLLSLNKVLLINQKLKER